MLRTPIILPVFTLAAFSKARSPPTCRMHQLQPLRGYLHVQLRSTRKIAIRFAEAGDQAKLHWIATGREHNRDCGVSGLGSERSGCACRGDDAYFLLD